MRYVGTRHPLATSTPLRSMPFMRTRAEVFGPTPWSRPRSGWRHSRATSRA